VDTWARPDRNSARCAARLAGGIRLENSTARTCRPCTASTNSNNLRPPNIRDGLPQCCLKLYCGNGEAGLIVVHCNGDV